MKKALILVLIISFTLLASTASYAVDGSTTEIGYRMQPLLDKLAAMTDQDIEGYLAKLSDMGTHWSRKDVGKLTGLEIIVGYPNGTFGPNDPVQVDQFIKMVVCSLGFKPGVGQKYWAQAYIDEAVKYNIIAAKEFTSYTKKITREEAARIIVKACLLKDVAPDSRMDYLVMSKIADYAKIKDDNKEYVLQAYELGLMVGNGGKFLPVSTMTRAEASAVIIRNLDAAARLPFKPAAGDTMTLQSDPYGGTSVFYPSPNAEVMKAAQAFDKALVKDKGFVTRGGNTETNTIMYTFYSSEIESKKNSTYGMQMGIDFELSDLYADNPYHITVYDAAAVKSLHRDVVYDLFKSLFGKDVDKAMADFDRHLGYAIAGNERNKLDEITYSNGRWAQLNTGGSSTGIIISSLPSSE